MIIPRRNRRIRPISTTNKIEFANRLCRKETTMSGFGRPITSISKMIHKAIMPPDIPHKSIITWPAELKVGNVEGKSESIDTHPSKDAAQAVCDLLRKQGFGGLGKHFPIETRVEPV